MSPDIPQTANFVLLSFLIIMAVGLAVNAAFKRPVMNWPACLCGLWTLMFVIAMLTMPWGTFDVPRLLGQHLAGYLTPALFAFVGARYWRKKHAVVPAALRTAVTPDMPGASATGEADKVGDAAVEAGKGEPEAIGGWLLLLGFAVVVNPFRQLWAMRDISSYYEPAMWADITTPDGQFYHPLFGAGIHITSVFTIVMAVGGFYCAYLFFKKKKRFAQLYPCLLVVMCGAVLFDLVFINAIPALEELTIGTQTNVIKTWLFAAIWVAYLNRSRRARNTFVH